MKDLDDKKRDIGTDARIKNSSKLLQFAKDSPAKTLLLGLATGLFFKNFLGPSTSPVDEPLEKLGAPQKPAVSPQTQTAQADITGLLMPSGNSEDLKSLFSKEGIAYALPEATHSGASVLNPLAQAGNSPLKTVNGSTTAQTAFADSAESEQLDTVRVDRLGESLVDLTPRPVDMLIPENLLLDSALSLLGLALGGSASVAAEALPVLLSISGLKTFSLTETNTVLTTSSSLTSNPVPRNGQSFVGETVTGTYGSLTMGADGTWTYTASSAHDELAAGQRVSDVFKVYAADGTPVEITVGIIGTNDAAVITGTQTFELTETNTALTANGTLTSTDVDGAANAFTAETLAGTYGSLTMSTNGTWTYTASSAHSELTAGMVATDVFAIHAQDGTASNITVNIRGTDSAAGVVVDGHIVNAMVSRVNALTNVQIGSSVFTDANGQYTGLPDGDASTKIVVQATNNSYDKELNTAFTAALTLYAPGNATVVNPITTLIQTLRDQDPSLDPAEATQRVSAALGLPAGISYLDFDPLVGTPSVSAADALLVQKAASQVALLVTSATLSASASAQDFGTVSQQVINQLTTALKNYASSPSFDAQKTILTNGDALVEAFQSSGLDLSKLNAALSASAQLNQEITNADSIDKVFATQLIFQSLAEDGPISLDKISEVMTEFTRLFASFSTPSVSLTEGDAAVSLNTSGVLSEAPNAVAANWSYDATDAVGTYGTFAVSKSGQWTFTANSAHNQLVEGQLVTQSLKVVDVNAKATTTLTVNITGTNDAPVISVVTPVPETTATLGANGQIQLTYLEGTAVPLATGGVDQSFLNLFKFQATDIDGPTSAITYQFGSPANLNDHSSYFEIVDVANEDYFYLAVSRLGSQNIASTTDSLNFNLWAKDAFVQSFSSQQLVDITYQKSVSANGTSALLPGAIGDWAISPLGMVDINGDPLGNGFNAVSLIDSSLVISLPSTVTELNFGDGSQLTLSNRSATTDAYNNIFATLVNDSVGTQTITVQDTTVSTQIELKASGNHTVVGAPDAFGDPGLGYVENLRTDTVKLSDANFAQAKFTILNDDLDNSGFKDGHSVKVDLQSATNPQNTIGTLKIDDIEYIEFQDKKVTLIGADIPRNEDTVIEINANGDYVIIGSTDTLASVANARHDSLDVVMQSNQSPLASFSTTSDGSVQMVLRDKTSNSVLGTTLMRDVESVQFVYKNANGDRTELDNIVIVAGGGYASLTEVEPRHSLSDANTFIYNPSSSYGNDVYHY